MKLQKILSAALTSAIVLSAAGCGGSTASTQTSTEAPAQNAVAGEGGSSSGGETAAADTTAATAAPAESTDSGDKLTLTVLTHRTDRLANGGDGSLEEMTKAFESANNCIVKYQGFTDYAGDVSTMMSTSDYGDVLMIPDTVKLSDLSNYFEPLGSYDDLKET